MTEEILKRYAKKRALRYYSELNSNLPDHLKLHINGDGRYPVIEEIIENTIKEVLRLQKSNKSI